MADYLNPFSPTQAQQGGAFGNLYSLSNFAAAPAMTAAQTTLPAGRNIVGDILANPYGNQAIGGGLDMARQAGPIAQKLDQGLGSLQTNASMMDPLYQQVIQQAFDPQQALYNRTFQQTQDQTNAINAMYGLSSSPYGAGVAGNTMANFNIDWQNNLLNRMNTGIGALGSLAGTQGGLFGDVGSLGQQELGIIGQGSQAPFQAFMGSEDAMMNALQGYTGLVGSAIAPINQVQQGYSTYLGDTLGAVQGTNQAAQQKNQMNQAALGGIGSLIGTGLNLLLPGSGSLFEGLSGMGGGGGTSASDLMSLVGAGGI